jgi:hypothetical protein
MYHPELFPELAQNNARVEPLPIKKKKVNPPREKKNDFFVLDFLVEAQVNTKPKRKNVKKEVIQEVKKEGESMVIDITNNTLDENEEENKEVKTVIKPYVYNESWGRKSIELARAKKRISQNCATNAFLIKETLDKSFTHLDRLLAPNTDFLKDLNEYNYRLRDNEEYRENSDEDRAGSDDELGEALNKQDTDFNRLDAEDSLSLNEVLYRVLATQGLKYNDKTAELIDKLNKPIQEKTQMNIDKLENLINDKKPIKEILEAFKDECNIPEEFIKIVRENESEFNGKETEQDGNEDKIKTKA